MVNLSELQTVTPSPDFIAAIKDTQSIAATVSRRSLLEKALSAAMNHTGAHSGRLLLADGGRVGRGRLVRF